jgi:hypothetical protein
VYLRAGAESLPISILRASQNQGPVYLRAGAEIPTDIDPARVVWIERVFEKPDNAIVVRAKLEKQSVVSLSARGGTHA